MSGGRTPFALVDCNNFYVSCERVFQPSLEGVPVIGLIPTKVRHVPQDLAH